MANLTLPGSPSDGDTVTHEGTKFTYNGTAGRWTRELLSSRIETVVPSTNTSVTATSVSGNTLVFTQADGSTANVDLSSLSGGQVTTYANESDLPSDADNGSHGYVTATTFLYVKATTGWYKITSVNLTPAVTVSSNAVALSAEAESVDVTYTVAEPEDTPVTITVSNTGISNTDQVTVTHHTGNNTLTILAGNTVLSGGSLTVSASDGVNIGTGTISIDLSLGINWAATLASPTEVLISTTQTQNDRYGSEVAIVGNTAIVATSSSIEGVDIYTKSSGSWTHVQYLLPTDTASGDQFGIQCAITPDENHVIIAAAGQDDGQTMAGKVYTFSKSGSTWSQSSSFQAPNPQYIYSTFGRTVLLSPDGTTLAVGQPGYDGNGSQNTGRFLIYTGSGSSWTYRTEILPATATNQQIGGHYLSALSNDTLAFRYGNGGVYVYTGSGASWSQQQLITESSPTALNSGAGLALGSGLAISGDNLALGASNADGAKGAVFVYTRSGGTWSFQQKLQPSGIAANEAFGHGYIRFHPDDPDILFIPAFTTDTGSGNAETGSVFIFQRSGSTWSQINRIDNPGHNGNSPEPQSQFGLFLGVSDNNLLIGSASQHTNASQPTWDTGAAYFYEA